MITATARAATTRAAAARAAAATAYATETLRPTVLQTEREGVTPERILELGHLGLLDTSGDRQLHEIIAGGCLNTWLVWSQHVLVLGRLAAAADGAALVPLAEQALRGELLVGAAISDVRRFPRGHIVARRSPGGWVLDGVAAWVSGWGLNAALLVAAVDETTRTVVTALVPVGDGMRASPLDLAAVRGSRTKRVHLDAVVVPDEQVVATQVLDEWRHLDLNVASDAKPHHFGLAHTVLDELDHAHHPQAPKVAQRWRPRVAEIRADAYRLADEAAEQGPEHRLAARLALKVASGEALATLTRSLVVARAGHGLSTDDTAQLYASSALFLLVQGQNADVREAQLKHLAAVAPGSSTRGGS